LKFKYIVIIINIIIILMLSAVALIPAFLFDFTFARMFWRSGWPGLASGLASGPWPLALVLCAALIALNIYFLYNRRLFWLLEREDWPALVEYLEQRVIHKGRYSVRQVQLLINSYLVMSDSAGVIRLEQKVAIARPALLEANALVFGAARILGGDHKGAAVFFQHRLVKAPENPWLRWYYGFSLILSGAFDTAEPAMKALATDAGNVLICGLSAYFLSDILLKHSAHKTECRSLADECRERIRQTLKSIAGWKKEAAKTGTEVHIAIIKKYIDEAGVWLFR
jgi:hypothetical protein